MQRHCKCSKKEIRYRRFWRKATPFVVVLVIAVLMVVSVNAAYPPTLSGENGSILGSTVLDGKVNTLEQQGGSIRYLTYYQMYCGCFGSYIPVMIFYDSSNLCNLLCVRSGNTFNVEYDPVGDVWGVTSSATMARWILTNRGFTSLQLVSGSESRVNSNVLYIWQGSDTDLPGLNLVYNEGYVAGTGVSPVSLTAEWRSFWEKVYNYEEDVTEAESKGYYEGYETGYYQGDRDGYQDGLNVGYEGGYIDGEEVGYQRGYEAGYDAGYDEGYSAGAGGIGPPPPPEDLPSYDEGYDQGYGDGYMVGLRDGYEDGYADGVTDGELNVSYGMIDVGSVITSIPLGAKQVIDNALNFELFGINVAGTLGAILIVAIIAFVVKWLIGRK